MSVVGLLAAVEYSSDDLVKFISFAVCRFELPAGSETGDGLTRPKMRTCLMFIFFFFMAFVCKCNNEMLSTDTVINANKCYYFNF